MPDDDGLYAFILEAVPAKWGALSVDDWMDKYETVANNRPDVRSVSALAERLEMAMDAGTIQLTRKDLFMALARELFPWIMPSDLVGTDKIGP